MATKNLGRIVGLSAYEVWLEQGNTGTEEDFLNSLKAEGGDVDLSGYAKKEYVDEAISNIEISGETVENPYKGKYLSILGASTATFEGYVPTGYKVYYPKGDVTSVDDMYWKIIIDRLGMNLCVNNSYSGASISGTDTGDVIYSDRATKLHTDEQEPDVILVNSGLNDFNSNIEIGSYRGNGPVPTTYTTFADAYAYMLNQVINRYPNAEIWCATQPSGATSNFGEGNYAFPVTRAIDNVTLAEWNNVIKTIANAYGCRVIELGKCGFFPANYSDYFVDYNQDGKGKALHPNKAGFQLIADQFVRQMLAKAPGGDGCIGSSSEEPEAIDLSQIKQVTDVIELPLANEEEYNKSKIYRMKNNLMYVSKDVLDGTGTSIAQLTTVLPEERVFSSCGVVGDYAYILGGALKNSSLTMTNNVYKMNLQTNEITKLNDLPIKIAWAGCAVVGTDIYIIGGRVQELTGSSASNGTKIYKYDTTNDTFTEMLDIAGTSAAYQSVSSIAVGTDIYTFGGNGTNAKNVTKYNTSTNQLTTLSSQVSANRMLIALAAYQDYIYLFGGATGTQTDCVDTIQKFDITNDTITTLSITLPENRGRTSVGQFGDNVLLFGGSNGTGVTYKDIVVFNISSETVSKLDVSLPTRLRGSMVAQNSNSECYLIGGATSSSYDTATDTIYKFAYGEGITVYGISNIPVLPEYPEFDENKSYTLNLKPNSDLGKYELAWIENIT